MQATYAARINTTLEEWHKYSHDGRGLQTRNNRIKPQLANPTTLRDEDSEEVRGLRDMPREQLLENARILKPKIAQLKKRNQHS
jgi:seryl-tRNA synthetase